MRGWLQQHQAQQLLRRQLLLGWWQGQLLLGSATPVSRRVCVPWGHSGCCWSAGAACLMGATGPHKPQGSKTISLLDFPLALLLDTYHGRCSWVLM